MTAGGVVVISLLGLYAIGVPFIANLGGAAALVVVLSIAVALTLLPALLGLCGRSLDRWRIERFYGEGGTPSETSDSATAQPPDPGSSLVVGRWRALVILVVLAAPCAIWSSASPTTASSRRDPQPPRLRPAGRTALAPAPPAPS